MPIATSSDVHFFSRWSTFLLLATLCYAMLPVRVQAWQTGVPQPRHQWILNARHARGLEIQPNRGSHAATLNAPARFSDSKPRALVLDGKETRLKVAAIDREHPATNLLPSQAITVETWINPSRIQPWGSMVSVIQDNGDYERGWMLGIREDMFCFGLVSASTRRLTYLTNPQPFLPGNWYHVTGTYDGKLLLLYVDGHLRARSESQQGPIAYPPTGTLTLGAYLDDNEQYPLEGEMAQVAIFDKALSAEQILARFRNQKTAYPNVDPVASSTQGWPTYARDVQRSAYTPETLTLPLQPAWTYQSQKPPAPAWPEPARQDFWHNKKELAARVTYDRAFHVVSDGRRLVFASSSEDHVTCLDAATAQVLWRYTTEGPVRLAPTLHEGSAYFGSDDGFVYCLDLTTGKLRWKHQAAPTKRRIPGNQRIISAWPVRSGIVIDRGQARFSAGLFPNQGTYQYAIDATHGTLLAKGPLTFSPQGYLTRRGTRLMVAQGRAPTPKQIGTLDRIDKPFPPAAAASNSEFPHATIYSTSTRYAGGNNRVAALDTDGNILWSAPVKGKAYSLAIAAGRLFVSTDQGTIHCFLPAGSSVQHQQITERPFDDPDSLFYETTDERLAYEKQADRILQAAREQGANPLQQGYCLVLGAGRGQLAYELAQRTRMQIIAVTDQSTAIEPIRTALRQAGLSGRVVVHESAFARLGYASQLFNLVCFDENVLSQGRATPLAEAFRLTRPAGGALIMNTQHGKRINTVALASWARDLPLDANHRFNSKRDELVITRKPAQSIGDWTHMYAGPENTACSEDQLVAGEMELQWFGRPGPQHMVDRHHRTVPPLVIGGRMFLPGNNRIIGVDAYNGTVLWETALPNFRRVGAMRDSGSMVASENILYALAEDRCHLLATPHGKELRQFHTPPRADKAPRHWGYLAHVGNELYGSTTRVGAARRDHSRQQISETYYDFIPLVTSDSVFCRERTQGDLKWDYRPASGAIINPTITVAAGRVYFVESTNPATLKSPTGRSTLQQLVGTGGNLVALNRLTGEVLWKKPANLGNAQHHLFLGYAADTLVAVSTRNHTDGSAQQVWYDVHAYSATDGSLRWQASQNQRQKIGGDHGEQDHHPAIVDKVVYVEPYAYDLTTGKRRANWHMARNGHGCGTISASATACFFRAGNPTMVDLTTGKATRVTQVSRPGCWINMIPAGGLLLIPEASSGCTCDFPIQTSMAFIPVQRKRPTSKQP